MIMSPYHVGFIKSCWRNHIMMISSYQDDIIISVFLLCAVLVLSKRRGFAIMIWTSPNSTRACKGDLLSFIYWVVKDIQVLFIVLIEKMDPIDGDFRLIEYTHAIKLFMESTKRIERIMVSTPIIHAVP